MKDHLRQRDPATLPTQNDQPAGQGWLKRLTGTVNYVVVIIFLGAWITGFIFLNEYLSTVLSGNLLTDLNCISFFGGLILAFLISAIASGLLRRFFWKSYSKSDTDSKN